MIGRAAYEGRRQIAANISNFPVFRYARARLGLTPDDIVLPRLVTVATGFHS